MNLNLFVLYSLTKDIQKQLFGEIQSSLGHHIGWQKLKNKKNTHKKNKTKQKHFSDFCHILALKYQPYCQNILTVYGLYKNTTIMEQTKPNILIIYFKTAALPPIEAYLSISKIEKAAIFEWVKIQESSKIFFGNFQGSKFYSSIKYNQKYRMVFCDVFQ